MTNELLIQGLPYIIGLIAVVVSIVLAKYNIKINKSIIVGILTKIAEQIVDKDIPQLTSQNDKLIDKVSNQLLTTSQNVMNKLNKKQLKMVNEIGKLAQKDKNKVTTGSTFMGGLLDLGKSIVVNSATNYVGKKLDKM